MVRVRRRVCNHSAGIEGSATQRELGSTYRFRAYDRLFGVPGSVERAIASADTPHLYGKVMHHCLIALRDNVRARQLRRAPRRLVDFVQISLQGITYWFAPDFWSAMVSSRAGMTPNTGQEKRVTTSAPVF